MTTFLFNNLSPDKMNYSKILIAFIVLAIFIISSCKKDELIIEGCTDTAAMNYNSTATSNDGSCVFAYDIAQGIWNISSACDDLTISIPLVGDFPVPLNDIFPPTIEITGEGNDVVSLDVNGNDVMADVSNEGIVTIKDNQTISFDTGIPLIGILDVNISGSGKIETATNGDLTLNLAFEVPLAGTQTSSCEITFTK